MLTFTQISHGFLFSSGLRVGEFLVASVPRFRTSFIQRSPILMGQECGIKCERLVEIFV